MGSLMNNVMDTSLLKKCAKYKDQHREFLAFDFRCSSQIQMSWYRHLGGVTILWDLVTTLHLGSLNFLFFI